MGEEGRATIGIINREHNEVSYRLEVAPIVLKPDEKWEDEVSFTSEVAGEAQMVEFLLYKQEQSNGYRSLYLRVNVKGNYPE